MFSKLILILILPNLAFATDLNKCQNLFIGNLSNSNVVLHYYELIDAHRTREGLAANSSEVLIRIMALFDPQAVYYRDSISYEGIDKIANFFQNIRQLSGKHNIVSVAETGSAVLITGYFEGWSNGVPIDRIHFTDEWIFDSSSGLVIERRSILSLPGH